MWTEYKNRGDILYYIINERQIDTPFPLYPTYADPINFTSEEMVTNMIFKGEVNLYIKRKYMLESNIQKANYLVIEQCTDLIQSKLNQ